MDNEKLIMILRQIRSLADEAIAEQSRSRRQTNRSGQRNTNPNKVIKPSFNANLLAFMKKYSRGLPGHNKFTLLLAGLTKGSISQEISSSELEKQWNKMKVVVGGKFNGAYATERRPTGG